MPSSRTRSTVVALVACIAGAIAVPTVSQARAVSLAVSTTNVAASRPVAPPTTTKIPVVTNDLQGHSNGQPGGLSDADCEQAAQDFNQGVDEASKSAGAGDALGFGLGMQLAQESLAWFKAGGCVAI
jgi:hypothetical protein